MIIGAWRGIAHQDEPILGGHWAIIVGGLLSGECAVVVLESL